MGSGRRGADVDVLERSQAFRFVVSPPHGRHWPPVTAPRWADAVSAAAREWLSAMETHEAPPALVAREWRTLLELAATPVDELAEGRPWRLCAALYSLHAIADETCAHGDALHREGIVHRGQRGELLVRSGSMARIAPDRLALIPKVRTGKVGMTNRSLSRYSCVPDTGIPTHWHQVRGRPPVVQGAMTRANVLLLPWPLTIEASDFHAVEGSVRRPEQEPFGFFRYEPGESLDPGLLDRLLHAAARCAGPLDAVVLPESALAEPDVEVVETALQRHGVNVLMAGVRTRPATRGGLPGNRLHVGVHAARVWWHFDQSKHHRWFLEADQIERYQLGESLATGVRWWEDIEVPRRSVHLLGMSEGLVIAAVICEDLARMDGVAELLRSVGPTLLVTILLDGPQLASRWTARYAGVLADDPGSAVLTLTAYGMVRRSVGDGSALRPVVAMWKDARHSLREISLDHGSQALVLSLEAHPASRYAADGRRPVEDAVDLQLTRVHQVRARAAPPPGHPNGAAAHGRPLSTADLSVLSVWADALAAALLTEGRATAAVTEAMRPGAPWREELGIAQPRARLARALHELAEEGATAATGVAAYLDPRAGERGGGPPLRALARDLLVLALRSELAVSGGRDGGAGRA